jgi:plasmid stabilization system protein ParE
VGRIVWTDEARLWLREIYDYIAQDSPKAALGVVSGIYRRTRILLQHPEIGHRYHERPNQNIRILLYGHYRIAYRVGEKGKIEILGVFHGALDIERHLK